MATGRTVLYLQSQENLSVLPDCYANLTVINVSSFHFGFTHGNLDVAYIHLNDNIPQDPMFDAFWSDMAAAQQGGVTLMLMLGGAGGAYTQLFANYETFYPLLTATIKEYGFSGVDLDVEEWTSASDIQRLINDLRADFPQNFYISSAPVAQALKYGSDPFSGIDWSKITGIDWFNVQFYSGYGSLNTTADYEAIIAAGYSPDQIVGGSLTNQHDGSGYVPVSTVANTLTALNAKYNGIGGAMGWEYFNANNTSEQIDPAGWCSAMKTAVGSVAAGASVEQAI